VAEQLSQREAVWWLDGGQCVACGKRHRLNASSWEWQAHHVIKAARLQREHVPSRMIRSAALCVLLCRLPCHMNHESRSAVIPLEKLPTRVVQQVKTLGTWAEDELLRYHPPVEGTAAGRPPA
jgi:hypothetical protein